MRNIYFYYPSNVWGGAEMLFVRILNYLAQHYKDFDVGYINFEESFLNKILDSKCKRIVASDTITLPANSTIIAPPFCLYKMPKIKSKNIFFLFWILHIEEFECSIYTKEMIYGKTQRARKEVSQNWQIMIDSDALIAMDEATKIACKNSCSYDLDDKHIIPVMLEDYPSPPLKQKLINEEYINIGWVGRLSSDKIYALINLMDNLEKIHIDKKIKLHIIGEGDSKHLLKSYKNFETIMLGTIENKKLNPYIENNLDLVFAMGTSMLEAEKSAIPAVMVFYTLKDSTQNSFLWTFKLKNYILGYEEKMGLISDDEKMTLGQILNDFLTNIPLHSKQAREHFESFLINRHISSFLDCTNTTTYSIKTYRKEKVLLKIGKLKAKWTNSIRKRFLKISTLISPIKNQTT
ncbi:hypothetical protein LS68_003145 [Helicobacter sp. MIT 05-5293]|uniref:hypothetical protein n=1 Tax=Helicobacter sp. MIT 05-5293 TaxID=1548149 RepID=UPI00051DEB5D|nr:hypothetical protein [Helicobacter sp. MIT 05-5293]TLD82018.1 hypothetical protein LS68_003145 [Helicobacter sp. MIT 05-5293]